MGTWGYHSFESDVAMDWLGGELGARGAAAISDALDAVLDDEADMLDADLAQIGITAVEALAIALGQPRNEDDLGAAVYPDIDDDAQKDLVQRANYVIWRVTGKGSELRALWDDASWDDRDGWLAALTDLRSRVNGEATAANPAPAAKAAPAQSEAPGEETIAQSLEHIRLAVSGLDARLDQVQYDIMEALARLSRKVEALSK